MNQGPYASVVATIIRLNTAPDGTVDATGLADYAERLDAAATSADAAGDPDRAASLRERAYVHRAAALAVPPHQRRRRWWWS